MNRVFPGTSGHISPWRPVKASGVASPGRFMLPSPMCLRETALMGSMNIKSRPLNRFRATSTPCWSPARPAEKLCPFFCPFSMNTSTAIRDSLFCCSIPPRPSPATRREFWAGSWTLSAPAPVWEPMTAIPPGRSATDFNQERTSSSAIPTCFTAAFCPTTTEGGAPFSRASGTSLSMRCTCTGAHSAHTWPTCFAGSCGSAPFTEADRFSSVPRPRSAIPATMCAPFSTETSPSLIVIHRPVPCVTIILSIRPWSSPRGMPCTGRARLRCRCPLYGRRSGSAWATFVSAGRGRKPSASIGRH